MLLLKPMVRPFRVKRACQSGAVLTTPPLRVRLPAAWTCKV
jgi:hypothetical protein